MKLKGFAGIINLFIGLSIAVILASSVLLPQIFSANTSGCTGDLNSTGACVNGSSWQWDGATTAIWGILGLVIVGAVLIPMVMK